MARYDAKQVCLNGHHITDRAQTSGLAKSHCSICGAETITDCPNCGFTMKGDDLDSNAVAIGFSPSIPDYCEGCGEPFPWVSSEETADPDINLPDSFFDEEIVSRCFEHYQRQDYQDAVRNAFILLEERIRDSGNFPQSKVGSDLAQAAFHPDDGPLRFGETRSEEAGIMNLYKSAFQSFRNPPSHRFLDEMDQERTYSILCFVNLLLKLANE